MLSSYCQEKYPNGKSDESIRPVIIYLLFRYGESHSQLFCVLQDILRFGKLCTIAVGEVKYRLMECLRQVHLIVAIQSLINILTMQEIEGPKDQRAMDHILHC